MSEEKQNFNEVNNEEEKIAKVFNLSNKQKK